MDRQIIRPDHVSNDTFKRRPVRMRKSECKFFSDNNVTIDGIGDSKFETKGYVTLLTTYFGKNMKHVFKVVSDKDLNHPIVLA